MCHRLFVALVGGLALCVALLPGCGRFTPPVAVEPPPPIVMVSQPVVRQVGNPPQAAMLVAERAVGGIDQGRPFVYVVNAQDVVERRDVRVGQVDGDLQVITDGVKPTDWVIVGGGQRAQDGLKVDPQKLASPVEQAAPPAKKE